MTSRILRKRKYDSVYSQPSTRFLVLPSDGDEEFSDYSLCSDSDDGPSVTTATVNPATAPVLINGRLISPSSTKRKYCCTWEGCSKSYTKPSRLEEHERSHTGERPFKCTQCSKAYLRETHLQAHFRTHLPDSDRPFTCGENGCGKKFWTTQHLRVHTQVHSGENAFKCTNEDCDASFAKNYQLRNHIAEAHSPPGTKPFKCEHQNCDKSFSTNQKLKAHAKIHDDKRYICSHPDCAASSNPYLPTWSSLQSHLRSHPPKCPHTQCNGRTFASQKGLKGHLKLHLERETEDALDAAEGYSREAKRRRGGEMGRDWHCDIDGCDKSFKSKKALTVHKNVTHLGHRDFACPVEGCGRTFGYKHLLQRHTSSIHSLKQSDNDSDNVQSEQEIQQPSTIDLLTGKAYIDRTHEKRRTIQCPWPHGFDPSVPYLGENTCEYVFGRLYDLRRHLKAAHGLEVEKEVLASCIKIPNI